MTKEERRMYDRDYYQKNRRRILAEQNERRHRYSVPRQLNSHGYYRQEAIEAAYEQRRKELSRPTDTRTD